MEEKKKGSTGKKLVLIITLLVLLCFLGFYLYSKGRQSAVESLAGDDIAYAINPEEKGHGLASMEEYEHWKDATFRISEYDDIPENYRRAIVYIFMQNGYFGNKDKDDDIYYLTSIKDRAKRFFLLEILPVSQNKISQTWHFYWKMQILKVALCL
ncbi:hypothetical protein [Niabella ginsengisoli]|uniref:Uncharacterized protein n=1 Tax=Niabella ginsengisoli TaxID=522298 RepID=A0ABS9SFI1_9BACT|nr:hypothetical protein [Niabella ginsengisoli]MCH5597117.1 hypothetical protein [Niabella ginsengisoli]